MQKFKIKALSVDKLNLKTDAQQKFIDQAAIDLSVKSREAFYAQGNGSWIKTNEIPA